MGGCPPPLWHRFVHVPSQGKDEILSAGYHPGIGCFSHKGSAKGAPPISGSGCTSHKVYKKESSPSWEVHLMGATRRCFFSWEGDVCENVLEPRSGLRLHAQGYRRGPLGRT